MQIIVLVWKLYTCSQNASPDVVKVLAGNKCDAIAQRTVDPQNGQKVGARCCSKISNSITVICLY